MTDPLTTSVMMVLGKYAVDKGVTLLKEVGPQAVEKAGALFKKALESLRRDPKGEMVADEYEADPKAAAGLLEKKLDAALQANANLKTELAALLAQYETAAKAHTPTYQGTVTGSGALAQGAGATAVGAGGSNIQHSTVTAPVITGSGNTITYGGGGSAQLAGSLSPNLASLRDKLIRYFSKGELRGLAFTLGVRHEDLPEETLSELAQSLVLHCEQRGRLGELVAQCRAERPQVVW